MNEKIRELAEQAGVDYGQTLANILCGDDVHDALGIEFNKLSKETREYICEVLEKNQLKFAELIVRECVGIVAKRKDQAIDDGCNVDEAMSVAEMDLLEHFGVEE